ncbi:hypothetical protein WL48_12220 [Burkholderia ubonensis]|nr:hypothetical protein WL49_07485 [Burkholderia ubonensis]KWC38893.1 hypothetical protein WL48_12220 [Burkholderia ubonensis]
MSDYQVLINTYGMGGLAIGLLIGKIGTQLPSSLSKLELWKAWLAGTGIGLLSRTCEIQAVASSCAQGDLVAS